MKQAESEGALNNVSNISTPLIDVTARTMI